MSSDREPYSAAKVIKEMSRVLNIKWDLDTIQWPSIKNESNTERTNKEIVPRNTVKMDQGIADSIAKNLDNSQGSVKSKPV